MGRPGACRATLKAPRNIDQTYSLEERPYCPACLTRPAEKQIRSHYAQKEKDLIKEAKVHGMSYVTMYPDVQQLREKMVEDINKIKTETAESTNDWTNHSETTWTEGIEEVLWDSETAAAIIMFKSGEMMMWEDADEPWDEDAVERWLNEGYVELEIPEY